MKNYEFPLLKPYQIECRVGQVTEKGFTLLLYETSRTAAEVLDEVVGQGNWQKKFYVLPSVGVGDKSRSIVVCSVGIYDEDKKEWIWKDDSGAETQVEQEKGVCSDSFKRAAGGSCWGIGRELYYVDFIFIKGGVALNSKGRYELVDKYASYIVKEIEWMKRPLRLKKLLIVNEKTGEAVYSFNTYSPTFETPKITLDSQERKELEELSKERYGENMQIFLNWLKRKYGHEELEELTDDQVNDCLKIIRKAKQ